MTDENIENQENVNPEQTADTEQQTTNESAEEQPVIEINKDARLWASLCHLSALAGLLFPFVGNIVGPLIVWMIKKDDDSFVDGQGKEAVNFQISVTIYALASLLLVFCGIGIVVAPAVGVFAIVMLIIATVKANSGIAYRYPLTIRFIK
jgi:uncharacterized Tic20 family protein